MGMTSFYCPNFLKEKYHTLLFFSWIFWVKNPENLRKLEMGFKPQKFGI